MFSPRPTLLLLLGVGMPYNRPNSCQLLAYNKLAGRNTLISLVSSTIPCHVMQNSYMLGSDRDQLDKYNWQFLWGGSENNRKISLVAWDEVCKPKKNGGLGIRKAKHQNQAFMMKLGWKLVTRRDDFWVKVVRDKYRCGDDLIPKIEAKRHGSNVWAGIKATWRKARLLNPDR